MKSDNGAGNPNPKAPPELSEFAFMIGKWRCDVRRCLFAGVGVCASSRLLRTQYPRRC